MDRVHELYLYGGHHLYCAPRLLLRRYVATLPAQMFGRKRTKTPIKGGGPNPVVQYADDTLLIVQACPRQLQVLKALLQRFALATGLQVNYQKTCMMPLNITADRLSELANIFGCSTGSLPFTYLGLPLGTTRPLISDLSPMVDQVERRLNASARFLDYGGRLTLVQSVLSSLPTHYLCSLKIPKKIIKTLDRARRHCL